MNKVAARIGNMSQNPGKEVHRIKGLAVLVVMAGFGEIRDGFFTGREAQTREAHRVSHAVPGESFKSTSVPRQDGHRVVDGKTGMPP